ncbi:MAG TPA: ribosome maturation factor RimM [Solirubrobacteraceae bacterium]|nr:ribosome maturation factor RimM [Solirubrobacteraceae bacterium]
MPAGRVGRPHGLDGSFYVTRPKPRLLELGTTVSVGGGEHEIVRRAGTEQRPIVRLDGIEDREAALELRGAELAVRTDSAPQLGEDEYWAHELEGCEVRAGERVLGTVTRMIELPSCEALEVQVAASAQPLIVPMVKDAIREVRIVERRIEVDRDFLDLPTDDPGAAA